MDSTEIRTAPYFKMVGSDEKTLPNRQIYVKRCEIWKRGDEVFAIFTYNDGDEYTKKLDKNEYSGWCVGGQAAAEQLMIETQ